MLTAMTVILAAGSLGLTALGAWKRTSLLSWLGGLSFVLFLACMLLLDRPWEEMLIPALLLPGLTMIRMRGEKP